jgi:signal peptidase I
VSLAIDKQSLAAEVLHTFGQARLPVTGGSMLPTFWPGDLLHIRQQPIAEIQPGEVVVFRRGQHFVAHRVIWNRNGDLHTQGDCLRHPDAPLLASDILGRVTAVERRGREVSFQRSRPKLALAWLLGRSEFSTRFALAVHRRLLA